MVGRIVLRVLDSRAPEGVCRFVREGGIDEAHAGAVKPGDLGLKRPTVRR